MYPEYFEPCNYDQIEQEELITGPHLAKCIREIYGSYKKIIEVGCGPGLYVKAFNEEFFFAKGIEIDERSKDKENIICSDIFDISMINSSDIVVSFEVAEHIPENLSLIFVEKLTSIAPIVIFSAARPGQDGTNHINCQEKDYWEKLFNKCGFIKNTIKEKEFVNKLTQGYHMIWMVQNVQIFNLA